MGAGLRQELEWSARGGRRDYVEWGPTTLPGAPLDTWVQVTQTMVVPAGYNALVKFQILFNDYGSPTTPAGTQYVDDIQCFIYNLDDRKLPVQSVDVDSVTGAVNSAVVDGVFWQDTSLNNGGRYDFYGEEMGVRIARKHIGWYCKEHADTNIFRKNVNQVVTASQQLQIVSDFFQSNERKQKAA